MRPKWLLIPITVLMGQYTAAAQDTLRVIHTSELTPHEFDVRYLKKWYYVKLRKPLTATVIEHVPAFTHCGVLSTSSITIVQTERGHTLRVIDLCNTDSTYRKGQTIRILPARKPPFDPGTPFTLVQDPLSGIFRPQGYDLSVRRTAFGVLEK